MSNAVITGLRPMDSQKFGYDKVRAEGIAVIHEHAARVDPQARQVRLDNGTILDYDRLVLAPGIDMRFDALPGYDEAVAETVPHAWKAGPQTRCSSANWRRWRTAGGRHVGPSRARTAARPARMSGRA